MNELPLGSITSLIFLVIIAVMALVSIVTIYVLVKYGRTRSLAIFGSLIFVVLFLLQSLSAFNTLQLAF